MELLHTVWGHYLIHVLDIAVVAYIFYRLILLIKGTRAVQIILGLLVIFALTFIAQAVHLRTTNWLLEKFWFAAVLILAIVFQPEIRTALAQLGSHPWGRIFVPSGLGFIDEIVDAVAGFHEHNTGALIVIEQDTGLRNYIETGTVVNGEVSKELLGAIFTPRSPLHDGAAIIQNARIIGAGCVLPLSHEPGLSKILGTRHRAGVGLSEISDAIIVIVSEESGMISIAREGRLESNLTPDDVRSRLMEIYRNRGSGRLKIG